MHHVTGKTLFDHAREERLRKEAPLAARMRPRNLDEYIGQQHILAPGRLLRRAISADQLSSLLFYGPPGTGKTTLASVIANTTSSAFVTLNAVMAGIADLKAVTAEKVHRLQVLSCAEISFPKSEPPKVVLPCKGAAVWHKVPMPELIPPPAPDT